MAVTLTVADLLAALRMGESAEETAEGTRLLTFATLAITKHAPAAPDPVQNEAAIRLCGYLFDQPFATRGTTFANAGRNSGAWAVLLPYRVHRAGPIGDAVDEAVAAADPGNPVTDVTVNGSVMTVTFADGSTVERQLPEGGDGEPVGGGVVTVEGGRLPGAAVAMRLGWGQSRVFTAGHFIRANDHPIDGATEGTTAGLTVPPFPPALDSDETLYIAFWIEGDPEVLGVERTEFFDDGGALDAFPVENRAALEVDGVAGFYYPSTDRYSPVDDALSVLLGGGVLLLTGDDVEAWARAGDATLIPAAKLTNDRDRGGPAIPVLPLPHHQACGSAPGGSVS